VDCPAWLQGISAKQLAGVAAFDMALLKARVGPFDQPDMQLGQLEVLFGIGIYQAQEPFAVCFYASQVAHSACADRQAP